MSWSAARMKTFGWLVLVRSSWNLPPDGSLKLLIKESLGFVVNASAILSHLTQARFSMGNEADNVASCALTEFLFGKIKQSIWASLCYQVTSLKWIILYVSKRRGIYVLNFPDIVYTSNVVRKLKRALIARLAIAVTLVRSKSAWNPGNVWGSLLWAAVVIINTHSSRSATCHLGKP